MESISYLPLQIYDLQVDFGDIGDLLKIRIEVDGSGVSPDYFLNKVELRDLDTEERMVCFVGKWLRWKGNEKHVQPYREFPVFRAAFEPLNSKPHYSLFYVTFFPLIASIQ